MNPSADFDYSTAFERNLGWVTAEEQEQLRHKRIAIAGMGGVGGHHLLTAARAGIGRFHIADFDRFELVNFNRQAGATVSHLEQSKVDVLTRMACDINPTVEIKSFAQAIENTHIDAFLSGVDLFIDGLDFFALNARRQIFAACYEKQIPAITAAPLGMGVACLVFQPGKMSFEEYFALEGHPPFEQLIRFAIGLAPRPLHMSYLTDPTHVDLVNQRVPSTAMACNLCAGVAVTSAIKILLRRGRVLTAPRSLHFDAYRNRIAINYRPFGNKHPLQRLGIRILRRKFSHALQTQNRVSRPRKSVASLPKKILDVARWAPSGDNAQPWRFKIHSETQFSIITNGHEARNVYDLAGWADQLSVGALIENIHIMANSLGHEIRMTPRPNRGNGATHIDIALTPNSSPQLNPLKAFIEARTTQRRNMESTPLSHKQSQALREAIAPDYEVLWYEDQENKKRIAALLSHCARIRLTIPEAYSVHKNIIEWQSRYSRDRIPDAALGLDPITRRIMQWMMGSWQRVHFANRFLAGTMLPRIQLDYLPALRCAGHFVLLAKKTPRGMMEYVQAGRALQRFWLTATKEHLFLQPQLAPLMFTYYIQNDIPFTQDQNAQRAAIALSQKLADLVGSKELTRAVFMGRIGHGKTPAARSLRKPLDELLI